MWLGGRHGGENTVYTREREQGKNEGRTKISGRKVTEINDK
jgi:hypothetical protein